MKNNIKNEKLSIFLKDKTFEERFGETKANEIKKKISNHASRKWSDKFSEDTVLNMKESAKKRMIEFNKNRIWTKDKIEKSVLTFFKNKPIYKNYFWKPEGRPIPSAKVVEKIYGSLDSMANEIGIKFYKHDRSKFLKENPDVLKKILKNNVIFKKGVKYNERYEKDVENKIKENLSKQMLERFKDEEVWNKGKIGLQIAWNKNLTKDDHDGIRKMSKARIEYMKNNTGTFISSQEKKLMEFFDKNNIKYISQFHVNNIKHKYLADFKIGNFIIEVDGIYWHSLEGRKELDDIRTKEMQDIGYKVLRFTDKEIDNEFDKVIKKIKELIL